MLRPNTPTAVLAAVAALAAAGCTGNSTPGLYSSDLVAAPGERLRVHALLVAPKGYGGHGVIFSHNGRRLGEGRPDKSGYVLADIDAPVGPAPQTIEMATDDGTIRGTGTVWTFPPERPLLVISEYAVSVGAGFLDKIRGGEKPRAVIMDAPDALRAMSATHQPMYFFSESADRAEETRAWLRAQGLPDGPVLTRANKGGMFYRSFGQGLRDHLHVLRSRFRGELVGVAFGPKEGQEYVDAGFNRVLVFVEKESVDQEDINGDYPKGPGVTVVRNWLQAKAAFEGRPFGGPAPVAPPPAGNPVPPPPPPPPPPPTMDLPPPVAPPPVAPPPVAPPPPNP